MALLDDIVEEAIRRKQLEAFNQALQEPSSVADRFVFGDPQLEAMEPTTQMQIGKKLQDYLAVLRKTFPEANPYGTAIEDFVLGGSEDLAREMTEGYKAVDFNNFMDANRPIIDPRVPEVASLIPVATGAKLATTIPTEFAATVGPMVAASRMTGRLVDPNAEDTGLLDAITGAALANQPVSNVGIFAGEIGARNLAQAGDDAAMQALDLAQSMENAGATPIEIWTETAKTGYPVYRGVDGKLRFEIDDSQAGFDKGIINQLAALRRSAENNPEQAELIARGYEDVQRGFEHGELGKSFKHEKAYETYPDVRGAVKARYFDLRDRGLELQNRINELEAGPEYEGRSVDLMNLMDERDAITAEREALPFISAYPQGLENIEYRMPLGLGGGSYSPRHDIITVESSVPELDKMDVRDRARSTTLHEMQHAIQQREGFESGSNPAAFEGTSATGEKRVGALDAEKAAQFNQLKNDPSYPGFLRLKDELYGTDEQKGILDQAQDLYEKEYYPQMSALEDEINRGEQKQIKLYTGKGELYETEPIIRETQLEIDELTKEYQDKGFEVRVEDSGVDIEALRKKQDDLFNEYEFRKSELYPEIEEYGLLRESLRMDYDIDPHRLSRIDEQIRLDPMQSYGRSAGEVEARLTQKRRDYTPAERAAKPAFEEFDFPVEQQLLRVDKSADPSGFAPVSLMDELSNLTGNMPTDQPGSEAVDEIMRMVGYHGTPHRFPPTERNPLGEFDLQKIGTGEGAQAYGHGIYVAENPNVAKGYQTRLAKGTTPTLADVLFPEIGKDIPKEAHEFLQGYEDIDKAVEGLRATANSDSPAIAKAWAGREDELAELNTKYLEAADWIEKNKKRIQLKIDEGSLYEVDIPDEVIDNQMLDYDAPLSEQSEKVRQVLEGLELLRDKLEPGRQAGQTKWQLYDKETGFLDGNYSFSSEREALDFLENPTGGDIYKYLSGGNDGAMAADVSALLRSKGISGIKYYDQRSRGKKGGTRNFVLFDPDVGKITGRN